jgi:hypothetical protein
MSTPGPAAINRAIDALITKLEQAPEGSPALDRELMVLDGRQPDDGSQPAAMWKAPTGRRFPYGERREVPGMEHEYPYTRSIDAALSLAQHVEGEWPLWTWKIEGRMCEVPGRSIYTAEITVPSREFQGRGRSPSLALCVAALEPRRRNTP